MNQKPIPGTVTACDLPGIRVRAHFWQDAEDPHPWNVLALDTGHAHMQTNCTPADLRNLAKMLTDHADKLQAAIKAAKEPAK